MNIIQPASQPTLIVGGRIFTDVKNLIQLRCYLDCTGSIKYSTPRRGNATSGYQVPASKQFRVLAIRLIPLSGVAASVFPYLGYGDEDRGIGGAIPSNPVYLGGTATSSVWAPPNVSATAANPGIEAAIDFVVPASKYIFIAAGVALEGTYCLFGYEETV